MSPCWPTSGRFPARVTTLSSTATRFGRLFARDVIRYVHLPGARRPAPGTQGFTQHRVAQRQLPRVRRLHADRGLRGRPREAARADRGAKRRPDVRGGGAVALPSLPRRRRTDRPRSPRRAHHQRDALDAAPHDGVRRGQGTRVTYPGEDSAGVPLATRAPFHLEATVRVLQRRPTNLVDVWEQERYLRVLLTADGLVLVEVANRGTIDDPDVRFVVRRGNPSTATLVALEQTVRKILGLDVDPEPAASVWPRPNAGFAPRRWRCAACGRHGSPSSSRRSRTSCPSSR